MRPATMAKRALCTVIATVVPRLVCAQIPDHLQCYKIKDPIALRGLVDLDSPRFGALAGCKISKARVYCVPTHEVVISASNGATPLIPLPFGAAAAGDRVCYKMACPQEAIADQTVTDQFGTRTVSKLKKVSMLCTPAVEGVTYCGDGALDGSEQCDGSDLGGATCATLGFASGTLACAADCHLDASSCVPNPPDLCGNGTLDANEQCDAGNLAGTTCQLLGFTAGGTLGCTPGCSFDTGGCSCSSSAFPATGQTTCWSTGGAIIPCAGTGQDGDVRAGSPLAYVDNGDGTITDSSTGLVWEKKSDDGSIHDKDATYPWGNAFAVHIATLNSTSFGGHNDWRVPNVKELQSIIDYGTLNPAVLAPFNAGCVPGCAVLSCSCTAAADYWSSSTLVNDPTNAWMITFFDGTVSGAVGKSGVGWVRAVRGGL